jgi:hypothetical protein
LIDSIAIAILFTVKLSNFFNNTTDYQKLERCVLRIQGSTYSRWRTNTVPPRAQLLKGWVDALRLLSHLPPIYGSIDVLIVV